MGAREHAAERDQTRPKAAPRGQRQPARRQALDPALQRLLDAGNAGTNAIVQRVDAPSLSTTLTVGAAHDPAEGVADRIAEELTGRRPVTPPPVTDEALRRQIDPEAASGKEFRAPGDLTTRLGARKGGGEPLPADVARSFGAKLGTDLSGVRVHTDDEAASMSTRLSAAAFTHGKDIYFGPGGYQPGTTAGRSVLAHEVAHTVQQDAAGDAQRLVLHRKTLATSKLSKNTTPRDAGLKEISPKLKKGVVTEVDLDDKKTDPKKGDFALVTQYGGKAFKTVGYVKLNALPSVAQSSAPKLSAKVGDLKKGDVPTTQAVDDDVEELPGTDVVTAITSVTTKVTKVFTKITKTSVTTARTGLSSGITSEVAAIFTIANTIRAWKQSKGIDSWDVAINGVGGVGSLVTGALQLPTSGISSVGGTVSTTVKDMGTDSGFVGGFLGDVVDVWKTFKSWWDTWHGDIEAKGSEQLARGTGDIITSALGAAEAFMSTVEKLLTTLKDSLGHLVAAIPGMGIAISALKIILRGWDWVKAHLRYKDSRHEKRGLKEQLGGKKGTKLTETDFKKKYDEIGAPPTTPQGTKTTGGTAPKLAPPLPTETPEQAKLKLIYERYVFQKFLQKTGMKVMKRAGAEIGAEAVNIAGEIATLTGVGAVAGAVLKGVSSGLKGAMTGARFIKKGLRETKFGKSIGFTGPTAKEKNAEYFKHATYILKQIEDVAKTQDEDMAKRVLGDLKNANVRVKQLKAAKDGEEQVKLITTAFKAR
ncbi:MAG: DUF4157 domain-containing protein [Acidimicrobiales bacterium]